MDRKTNLRDMDAPGVASGKEAGDTILKGTATYPLPSEKGSNTLEEYTTEKLPTEGASGRNKFK
jgi:hypothetical protein